MKAKLTALTKLAAAASSINAALELDQIRTASAAEVIQALCAGRNISQRAAQAAVIAQQHWTDDGSPKVALGSTLPTQLSSDFYCDEAISGVTPINVVHETPTVLAFEHTRPFWPVHIVVVPKQHVPSLTDLGEFNVDVLHDVLSVVRVLAAEINNQYGSCRVLTNLGEYQDSKHLHFHVAFGDDFGENRAR